MNLKDLSLQLHLTFFLKGIKSPAYSFTCLIISVATSLASVVGLNDIISVVRKRGKDMKRIVTFLVIVLLPVQILAKPVARSAPTSGGSVKSGLRIAFGLPRIIAANVYMSRSLVVEAVYQATLLSGGAQMGRVVNTGTLALALGGLQYSPQPADRLVVVLGQQTHEFVVKEAQGNMQAATAAAWVMSPHILRYIHRLPRQAQAEIAARFDGVRFGAEAQGWYMQSGTRYELSLKVSGQSSGRRDYHGQEVQTAYALTGKITGGGLEIDVNEQHTSGLAAATNLRLRPSQRGSASRFNATINNVLRIGGVKYKFQNVQVQTDQKARGGQGQAGLTRLEGRILREGATFGRLVLRAGRAFLETASGPIALDVPPPGRAVR